MNKITKTAALLAAALVLPTAAFASSEIGVSPLRVNFTPTSKYKDVKVSNIGKSKAYVKVTSFKVLNPGTKDSKQVVMKNPAKFGLITSPRKLVILPGTAKVIRLVPTIRNNKQDLVYNVQIMPVEPHLMADKHAKKDVVGGIRVVIGYDVGVVFRPAHAHAKLSANRHGKHVTIHNSGNTNVILTQGKQCNSHGKACKSLPEHRLYAGNTWSFMAPYATKLSYTQTLNGKRSELSVS